jgi:capsular exopolysaccharide synthesis family protein
MTKTERTNMEYNGTNTQVEEPIEFMDMIRITLAYKWVILSIFAFSILVSYYKTITSKPEWRATTALLIRESATDPSSFVFDFGASSSQQRLKNEIQVIESYSLHSEIVKSMIETGLANESSLFGTRYIRKRYRAISWFTNWLMSEESLNSQHVEELDNLTRNEFIGITKKLGNSVRVIAIRETDVLKVSVNAADSTDAVLLTNLLANKYRNLDIAGGRSEIQFVLSFLDSQIFKYEKRLESLEESLRAFQTSNDIYSLDGSADLLLQDLTKYESIYYTNLAELEVAKRRVDYLREKLSDAGQQLMEEIGNTNNPMIVALRDKIAEAEARKIQEMVNEGWSENSLQVRDYNRRISEMKTKLTELTENLIVSGWSEEDPFAASQEIFNSIVIQEVELYAAKSRSEQYDELVSQMSARLNKLPAQTLQYARLERERQLNENLYLTMKQKYEESRITEAGQVGKVRILDPALVAVKTKPNKKLNLLLGLFLAGAVSFIYIFLREYLDNTIKSVEELERKGLSVIGIIPDMIEAPGKKSTLKTQKPSHGGQDFQRRLITHEDPKSPISEAFRAIRTNVNYSQADRKIKSLLVSSPQPGEGKSTTVANIAIAFAQLRKRTVLIDADLRKPVQHNVFGLPRGPGLTDYLVGETENISEIINETQIDGLHLITAGNLPPNPSELLGSERMNALVDKLEQDWDMVLFDSPPLIAVTDASMISSEIDALAIVVKAGYTPKEALDRALDTVGRAGTPLAGIILNGIRPESISSRYSYYYSYYQYYYAEEGSKTKKSR